MGLSVLQKSSVFHSTVGPETSGKYGGTRVYRDWDPCNARSIRGLRLPPTCVLPRVQGTLTDVQSKRVVGKYDIIAYIVCGRFLRNHLRPRRPNSSKIPKCCLFAHIRARVILFVFYRPPLRPPKLHGIPRQGGGGGGGDKRRQTTARITCTYLHTDKQTKKTHIIARPACVCVWS